MVFLFTIPNVVNYIYTYSVILSYRIYPTKYDMLLMEFKIFLPLKEISFFLEYIKKTRKI